MSTDRLFDAKLVRRGDCLLYLGSADEQGYGRLSRFAISRSPLRAHRYAWMLANGPIPDGAVIRHTCDNPPCCNPAHLLIGTQADNIHDRQVRGRHRPGRMLGEAHPAHKLTADQVLEMRRRYAAGASCRALGIEYGVAANTAYEAVHRITWRELAA